jgi:hypothetical protein
VLSDVIQHKHGVQAKVGLAPFRLQRSAVQEPDEAPFNVSIGAASFEHSEIRRLPTRLLHRLEARAPPG